MTEDEKQAIEKASEILAPYGYFPFHTSGLKAILNIMAASEAGMKAALSFEHIVSTELNGNHISHESWKEIYKSIQALKDPATRASSDAANLRPIILQVLAEMGER